MGRAITNHSFKFINLNSSPIYSQRTFPKHLIRISINQLGINRVIVLTICSSFTSWETEVVIGAIFAIVSSTLFWRREWS